MVLVLEGVTAMLSMVGLGAPAHAASTRSRNTTIVCLKCFIKPLQVKSSSYQNQTVFEFSVYTKM
jgi:hypothetical protein